MTLRLDAIGLVVADMTASLAFYRGLGLEFPDGAERAPHAEADLGGGFRLMLDTEETVRSFQPGWQPPADAGRIGLAVRCPDPATVDSTYAALVAAGAHGELKPFDAPWGQRYASIQDPDGNGIDLYAALDS
ncbi:VOC family protein [Nocardia sp. NPDC050697]|uniref:VOC family protein n=1 Tax=Nocardia sp. NPDC050697 TaxID=3155158 RepID=UPI0033E37C55